jgi:hypothetical protein
MARDNFKRAVIRNLALRVNYHCSRCDCYTTGPTAADAGVVKLGIAAHITAAAPGGPRFNPDLDPAARSSIENAIWLCLPCAAIIDKDADNHPGELLRTMKAEAEQRTRLRLDRGMVSPVADSNAPFTIADLAAMNGADFSRYRLAQQLPLTKYSNGLEGHILILVDHRLVGVMGRSRESHHQGVEAFSFSRDLHTLLLQEEEGRQTALLFVVDDKLRIVYERPLGRASARLDRVHLYEDKRRSTFIVTTDFSIGWGSYNGPVSEFLEVRADGIFDILPDGLMTSLKSAWGIGQGSPHMELWYKTCRPNYEKTEHQCAHGEMAPLEFLVTRERFRYDGSAWNRGTQSESGYWEYEESTAQAIDPREFQF